MRLSALLLLAALTASAADLTLDREQNWLILRGPHLPAGEIRINYLEAYCRPNSTDADWVAHTVIPHDNKVLSVAPDRRRITMRDVLTDGVTVDHVITARPDELDFRLTAVNPRSAASDVHWAQPCVRLGAFTGFNADHTVGDINDYLPKCFIFLDDKLNRFPTPDWATKARYMPGQVWRAPGVPATDVNPRPLSSRIPSNGLIGCFSGDEKLIFATAWEPWQELFQGIARCIHSDFRIGGLAAREKKQIRGKIYVVPNDVQALLKRYYADFPEHRRAARAR